VLPTQKDFTTAGDCCAAEFQPAFDRYGSDSVIWRCRLNVRFTPDKQTSTGTVRRSDKCHKATFALQQTFLFDHLVGAAGERQRDGDAERPGGLGIDDEVELGRLHDRQVAGLLALENAAGIDSDLAIGIIEV
jgi:hypothetical protein